MFMERWNNSISFTGYNTMVTMQSWMFLSSYEVMRKNILAKKYNYQHDAYGKYGHGNCIWNCGYNY